MSVDTSTSALVLGGIRSGKSEFAESLIASALVANPRSGVRYVATAYDAGDDPGWSARIEEHRERRPAEWTTEELTAPEDLLHTLGAAGADEIILVDDLGGWVARLLDRDDARRQVGSLAWSVASCRATLVLVSSEVGLGMVPSTQVGADFADLLGYANRLVADSCAKVALVVAGQPTWIKNLKTPAAHAVQAPAAIPEVITPVAPETTNAVLTERTMALPVIATGLVIQPNMDLPMPSEDADRGVTARLATLDLPGGGFGLLSRVLSFAAKTQETATPVPWRNARVVLIHGDYLGDASAGTSQADSAHQAELARSGAGPIGLLAARAGATIQVVDAPDAPPIEQGDATSFEAVDAAMQHGWRIVEEAVDSGVDLIVLGSCGAGAETAAATIVSSLVGTEIAALLGRRVSPDGTVNDEAWMRRCVAARDALRRVKPLDHTPRDLLVQLGGVGMATAVGALLGATARRTGVIVDGPFAIAAGLIARDLAGQSRHWCLMPDHGGDPATKIGGDVLGLDPLFDLQLDLGEGARALATLPIMQGALALAESMWAQTPPATGADEVDLSTEAADEPPLPGGPGFATPTGEHPVVPAPEL